MFYSINGKNFSASLATADGIVVQASGKVVWMCGQRIERVVGWATHHQLRWTVSAEPPPDASSMPARHCTAPSRD